MQGEEETYEPVSYHTADHWHYDEDFDLIINEELEGKRKERALFILQKTRKGFSLQDIADILQSEADARGDGQIVTSKR